MEFFSYLSYELLLINTFRLMAASLQALNIFRLRSCQLQHFLLCMCLNSVTSMSRKNDGSLGVLHDSGYENGIMPGEAWRAEMV